MTPEGRVKVRVKRIIKKHGRKVYSHWPVLNGMGEPTLDCNGTVAGRSFSVETKAPGENLTLRQQTTARNMRDAGVTVFVIIGIDEFVLAEFDAWLQINLVGGTWSRSPEPSYTATATSSGVMSKATKESIRSRRGVE